MKEFEDLGKEVEQKWHASDYNEDAFVEIARNSLERARLHERVSLTSLCDLVFDAELFPNQENLGVRFGQPPICVFSRPRFYIEVLFWLEGTTSIHTHGWSGAFQVLQGSSVHSTWSYEAQERVSRNVMLGNLAISTTRSLRRGDVEAVRPGFDLIHSLFHLDHPSISLVVRTLSDARVPQYSIHYPGILLNYYFEDARLTRRLEMLELLSKLEASDFVSRCEGFLGQADFLSTMHFFAKMAPILARVGALPRMFASAAARQGARRAAYLGTGLKEFQRQLSLVELRRTVRDPELRLFLACLMNAYDHQSFVDIVTSLRPNRELADQVDSWTSLLSENSSALSGLDGVQRSVLSSWLLGSDDLGGVGRRLELPPAKVSAIREELRRHPILGFPSREGLNQ